MKTTLKYVQSWMLSLSRRISRSNVASLKLPPEAFILAMLRLTVSGEHSSTGVPHDNMSSYMHCLVQSWSRVPGHTCRCTTLPVNVDTCGGYWRSSSHDTFLLGTETDTCGDPGVEHGKTSLSCEWSMAEQKVQSLLNLQWLERTCLCDCPCLTTKLMFNYMCMCSSMNHHPRTTCCSTPVHCSYQQGQLRTSSDTSATNHHSYNQTLLPTSSATNQLSYQPY